MRGAHDGRRHSYVVASSAKPLRDNAILVSGQFFELIVQHTERWLAHLATYGASSVRRAHVQTLPRWARTPLQSVGGLTGRDSAVQVVADLLTVSPRTVYRRLAESAPPPEPTEADRLRVRQMTSTLSPADLYRLEKAKRAAK